MVGTGGRFTLEFGARVLLGALAATLLMAAPAGAAELRVDQVRVAMSDGVRLDGWIVRPASERPVPVVLWSAPYFGQCNFKLTAMSPGPGEPECRYATGDDSDLWDNSSESEAVPVNVLVEHGYAVAIVNVRGTGNSGGCFGLGSTREQRDQAELVEWLADQSWSTGAIGMMGLSYHATTALGAAVQRPPHLRTVVAAAGVPDWYGFFFSPQGATIASPMYDLFWENWTASTSLTPPAGGTPQHATAEHAPVAAERVCREVVESMTVAKRGGFAGHRDEAFFRERRLIDDFPRIRASLLITHGLQDLWGSGHKFGEDDIWRHIRAPRQMLLGQWGHAFPNFNSAHPDWAMTDWNQRLLAWFDYWLKGKGRRPRLNRVEYQDDSGAWHRAKSWPPKGADTVSLDVGGTFVSYPQLDKLTETTHLMCTENAAGKVLGAGSVVQISEPLERDTLIAGNPFADLRVESDQDGGQLSVNLFDVAPDFACEGNVPRGVEALTLGAADLRFHHGGFEPVPFPVGRSTRVRIDLANLAARVPAGHRLGVVLSFGDPAEYETFPHIASRLKVSGRVQLPVFPR